MFFARLRHLGGLTLLASIVVIPALSGCGGGGGGPATPTSTPSATGTPFPTATAVPVAKQRIAWMSDRDGTFHIYVMNGDGSGQVRLTQNTGLERSPAWSKDGTRLVFSYSPDKTLAGAEIYSVNANGMGLMRLTNNAVEDNSPALSPDGQYVVWAQATGSSSSAIFLARSNGTGVTKLSASGEFARTPTFDPQGRIVYSSKNVGVSGSKARYQIVRVNRDGSARTQLTSTMSNLYSPSISPDGQTLVYVDDASGDFEMYTTPVASFNAAKVPFSQAGDSDPTWTPDGRIVFSSIRDNNPEIYVATPGGSSLVRLTNNLSTDRLPVATGPSA